MTTPAGDAHDFATDPDTYARQLRNTTVSDALADLLTARDAFAERGKRLHPALIAEVVGGVLLPSVQTQERLTRPRAPRPRPVALAPEMTGLHGEFA